MRAYERLLEYVKWPTASDPAADTCPSTEGQKPFGAFLVKEMQALGIADAAMDDNGYVMGTIPANQDKQGPVLGFIAHMDVSKDAPSVDIKARIVKNYDGGDIVLNEAESIVMGPDLFESLKKHVGEDLIVTDGTTLLGGDDKSGIAEILTMAEYLLTHPEIPHGTIKIGFTPDQEIGRGADLFDVKAFGADFAYTVDGGPFDEVVYETFNAASAEVLITGFGIHPGSAKDKMRNAAQIAMEFHGLLPAAQRPEHTEVYDGFYHLTDMKGHVESASLGYIIRDHDREKLQQKIDAMERSAAYLNSKYPAGTVQLTIKHSYLNMAEEIKKHWHLIENAYKAVEMQGGTPYTTPIRGGTDGSRLSFMGLPCPNLGTGGYNAHGRMEYVSVQAMDKCTQNLINLVAIYAE